jgi:hypothetical protein
MMACIGRKRLQLFKLIKYKIVVFHEVYILFIFNIILKHNGMSSTKNMKESILGTLFKIHLSWHLCVMQFV